MPDTVEIEDVATTKTAAEIDPDGDYAVLQSAGGDTFRALVEQVVRGVLAQIVAELEIGDDVTIDGGLIVDNGNAGAGIQIDVSGVRRVGFLQNELSTGYNPQYVLVAPSYDNGANAGPAFSLGRNDNASTPAAGFFRVRNRNNTSYRIWVDGSGDYRLGTSDPTNANDTSGTVVGTQTSAAAAKHLAGDLSSLAEVAERVEAGAAAVRRFVYRSGSYNGQEFEGVIIDDAPEYGMDRDADHPAGKSLNEIQIMGDLLRLVADLHARLSKIEGRRS